MLKIHRYYTLITVHTTHKFLYTQCSAIYMRCLSNNILQIIVTFLSNASYFFMQK